jgi:hypothetical protein
VAVHPSEELPFDDADPAAVLAVLAELIAAGGGWVNMVPEVVEGHEPPPRNLVVSVFSARGEAVPMATWAAAAGPGGRPTLGIEHGAGPRALQRLAEAGLPLPAGFWKVADHARRGLVVTAPADADPEATLHWLLTATHALSTVPLTGSWLARVYRPGR